jgi:hypothetical protein
MLPFQDVPCRGSGISSFAGVPCFKDKFPSPPTLANFLCGSYVLLFLLSILSEDSEAHPRELHQLPRLESGK